MPNRPLFSILHTSARPDKWRAVYDNWMSKAVHPEDVEYVLCVDERWGFVRPEAELIPTYRKNVRVVWNDRRRCYVDGVNIAAEASTGTILIVNADDQFASEGWDRDIARAVEFSDIGHGGNGTYVVSVSTRTPLEHEREIMVMPILSRGRYEECGYVFFPEYESMYADNDFAEHAKQDGVIIHARHLVFPHRHPLVDESIPVDEAYAAQNRKEAFATGENLLARRRKSRFGRDPLPESKVIAICLSGEKVDLNWSLATIGELREVLRQNGWTVVTHSAYTTNVYVTRMLNTRSVMESVSNGVPRPDFVLWIDDDNIVTSEVVEMLADFLRENPKVDLAAGWCWICSQHDNVIRTSCGVFSPDGVHLTHFDNLSWAKSQEARHVEWTGFPCCLMRYSLLAELGPEGFLPIIDSRLEFGMAGEDASFCKRAIDAGHELAALPRAKVQHVKPRAIEPFYAEQYERPKVAAMLRVHNEARWIARVINSLKELCGENIFVLNDESTDDTASLALAAGATVWADPFPGEELNEARDKDWLVNEVVRRCDPDWILCVDGDEELEPLGTEKILGILRHPQFDCYGLKFIHLWNDTEHARFDRWYSAFARQGLFRPSVAQGFRSHYEGKGVHAGLHTSNAPAGIRWATLEVYLIHYGYMLKEDRIRKYHYYNRIDPNNEIEDRYRHTVQGDIPEVPADAVLKHAGPLEIRKLPASIAPKFEIEVAPLSIAE